MPKSSQRKKQTCANRGLAAEHVIEIMNNHYRQDHVALFQKIPTEWRPLRGSTGKIVSAKVERKASVDYIGNIAGIPAAFDVKSVTKGTRWPLRNLTQEQILFLAENENLGGLSFMILVFWESDEAYVIPNEYIIKKILLRSVGGSASLSTNELSLEFEPLKTSNLNYLQRVINKFYRHQPPIQNDAGTEAICYH